MTILTDTLVEKGTINMTYNSQSYIYIHTYDVRGGSRDSVDGGWGLSYGAIFSIIDGTNCSSKAVLACRSVNLVFISFSV